MPVYPNRGGRVRVTLTRREAYAVRDLLDELGEFGLDESKILTFGTDMEGTYVEYRRSGDVATISFERDEADWLGVKS